MKNLTNLELLMEYMEQNLITKIMKQAKEVARQFKEELNQLLKKYNATIELQEQNTIHWERGDEHIIVYIDAVYKDGDCLAEWAEIDLGRNIYPD